jgi:hypothetical protein
LVDPLVIDVGIVAPGDTAIQSTTVTGVQNGVPAYGG